MSLYLAIRTGTQASDIIIYDCYVFSSRHISLYFSYSSSSLSSWIAASSLTHSLCMLDSILCVVNRGTRLWSRSGSDLKSWAWNRMIAFYGIAMQLVIAVHFLGPGFWTITINNTDRYQRYTMSILLIFRIYHLWHANSQNKFANFSSPPLPRNILHNKPTFNYYPTLCINNFHSFCEHRRHSLTLPL